METPVGYVPAPGTLDVDGLDSQPSTRARRWPSTTEEWAAELPLIEEWFDKFGDRLPAALWTELDALRTRLGVEPGLGI